MTRDVHPAGHARSRRRHDLEMLLIPISLLIVMAVLALVDSFWPGAL